MPDSYTIARLALEARAATDELIAAAAAAEAVQWEAPETVRSREDTTERSKGGPPSDPTADLALHPRRLAVRAALGEAALGLGLTVAKSREATRALRDATAAHGG